MTLEEILEGQLKAYPDLVALIGERVFPLLLPENPTLPAVTYGRTNGERAYTFDGEDDYSTAELGFSCWSKNYLKAKEVADKLADGLRSCLSLESMGSIKIRDGQDNYYNEIGFYQVPLIVTIMYKKE